MTLLVVAGAMLGAWADDDTYCVIDLSGGPTAASYPLSFMAEPPEGGFCHVTFDENFEGGSTTNMSVSSTGKILANAPSVSMRTGWRFVGWFTAPEGGEQVSADTLPTDGATYYAHWAEVSCDKVQLWEDGPYWATINIGAEEPWESGYYFWWGDTIGYRRDGSSWVASDGSASGFSFSWENVPTYDKSVYELQSEGWVVSQGGTYVLAPEHDAAQAQWGGGWRMPTVQDLNDLCYYKCDWIWTTTNGVNGYLVRGKGEYSSASIFLPCTGYGSGYYREVFSSQGYYWSSVPASSSYNAGGLGLSSESQRHRVYFRALRRDSHPSCSRLCRYVRFGDAG